ncbi:NADH:ubiquinone oxidoreductase, subunit RnfA [Ruminococcaceae bacterium OttesenSCG-928-O06]|nr:NADH:ubiquinone oxidoreductase, subunit RnfA [Ruminococcaceae bacterium OttesenSCG-928-O06]
MQNLGTFMVYALAAMFVQNAVFTRGFGVSRLTKLVADSAVDSMTFCALLSLINVLCAPMSYFVNQFLLQPAFWYRNYVRPLAFTVCALIAFAAVFLVIALLNLPNKKDLLAVLPLATLNCAVLGPMLITANQNYNFAQTMGFALGSGLGYAFAVIIVTEGQRKMNSRSVPAVFRGLPINLIYIGILALAIYSLTGHRVAI